MAYMVERELHDLGFKHLGKNVKVSTKAVFYNPELISIDDNSRVDDFCLLSGKISIGKFVHVTPMCLIAGGVAGVFLHDYSTLAYGVKIFSQSDDYSGETMTNSLLPKKYKKEFCKSVTIGKFAIIGAGSTILPGANIGEGVSVGAMSLILKETQEWKVYAGVPAKIIKARSKNLLRLVSEFENELNDTI